MLFPVKIILKKTENCVDQHEISVFDGNLKKLLFQAVSTDQIETITTRISLPNKLIVEIKSLGEKCALELDRFVLAGVDVNKSSLQKCMEYKYLPSGHAIAGVEQLNDLESTRAFYWNQNGYGIVNIFHPNPFLWHLNIGNQIKIH